MRSNPEVFGAALAVVASILSNIGVNIQKYSHASDAKLSTVDQRPYVQRPLWWLGFSLVIVGSIGDFTAFGFATQSLVAALGGGATLVTNVFAAYFMNKEAIFATDLEGVGAVIGGVIIVAFIAEANVEEPLPVLEDRFARPGFVVYVGIVATLIVGVLTTIKGSAANRLSNQLQSSRRKQKAMLKQLEARIERMEHKIGKLEGRWRQQQQHEDGSWSHESTLAALAEPLQPDHGPNEHASGTTHGRHAAPSPPSHVPICYAVCSGMVGSFSVLLAKCSAVMVRLSLQGQNQFVYPLTYVFIGGMFVCIVIQTHFQNVASSLGDIMVVFPVFQACWISFSVIGGAVFYESEKTFSPQKWALYPAALLFIAFGVALLVHHTSYATRRSDSDVAIKQKQAEVCLLSESPLLADDDDTEECGYLEVEV